EIPFAHNTGAPPSPFASTSDEARNAGSLYDRADASRRESRAHFASTAASRSFWPEPAAARANTRSHARGFERRRIDASTSRRDDAAAVTNAIRRVARGGTRTPTRSEKTGSSTVPTVPDNDSPGSSARGEC